MWKQLYCPSIMFKRLADGLSRNLCILSETLLTVKINISLWGCDLLENRFISPIHRPPPVERDIQKDFQYSVIILLSLSTR